MANSQTWINRLCQLIGAEEPHGTQENEAANNYVFEKRVDHRHRDGTTTALRIDCYKRNCFILEAKQSSQAAGRAARDDSQGDLLPEDRSALRGGTAKRGTAAWDAAMKRAYNQAVGYVAYLPIDHRRPPFVVLLDVGHVIELYANFAGQGTNYTQFPDRRSFQIRMEDLRRPEIRERLCLAWTDPDTLDPALRSAEVSRDIAERLAKIARSLESKKQDAKEVAEFLMRCLFTMFAEDVELLPKSSFCDLLEKMAETPQNFVPALESLWAVMDSGGYAPHLNATLKRFNGTLFKSRKALKLDRAEIHELYVAAKRDWTDVEPAIFGTLLERALDKRERAKLGAHYTPRAYVERLVVPTIIEPLREEWKEVHSAALAELEAGSEQRALRRIRDFHHKLCTTRVLDPACGAGNFLYVSLELMKKLEGEVLEAMESFGRTEGFAMANETVEPSQFFGLESNPRAAPIADLVLWIGYLKWQLRTVDPKFLQEPILHAYGTIREQDAILAYDSKELARDDDGKPITVWDGTTYKAHATTGKLVPDTSSRVETYSYRNPKGTLWPEADFIVGNPPFVGNKLLRRRLGGGYVDALFSAYPHLPNSLDFVSYWWSKAATLVAEGRVRAFGLVTTKTITQVSNRPVVANFLKRPGTSIPFAIPNHPWTDSASSASVRVAFSVGEKREGSGLLQKVISERRQRRKELPIVDLSSQFGNIQSDFSIGIDVNTLTKLRANSSLSYQGCKLGHDDFQLSHQAAKRFLDAGYYPSSVRMYIGGDQIKFGQTPEYVIDLFGRTEEQVRTESADIYQYLLDSVKPHKDQVRRGSHRDRWWLFGEPRPDLRSALNGITRYIATVEVSKHRYFVIYPWPEVLIDGSVIAVATDQKEIFSVLHSRPHVLWSLRLGGRMGVGNDPRYQNSVIFDPFPFPPFSELESALLTRLRELGERLDAFRKERLTEHADLTMTGLYNVLERVRELDCASPSSGDALHRAPQDEGGGSAIPPLTAKERDIYEKGLIAILKEIHDHIDRAVLEAYGWLDLAPALAGRPGATTPSPHKSEEQEAAEEKLLTRLVTLNRQRTAEEARGLVRWLRPDYQIPKLGHKVKAPEEAEQIEADIVPAAAAEQKPTFPTDAFEQIRLVRDVLAKALGPAPLDAVAASFSGRLTAKRRDSVGRVLEHLVETGLARTRSDATGEKGYFAPR